SGIQGTIVDPTSAAVAGVVVRVTNVDTGVIREVISSDSGVYRVPSLGPGRYDVTASKPGFSTAHQNSVVLAIDEIHRVDFALSIGNVSESVNVTEQVAVLETEEGRISAQITTGELRSLPIPNRN